MAWQDKDMVEEEEKQQLCEEEEVEMQKEADLKLLAAPRCKCVGRGKARSSNRQAYNRKDLACVADAIDQRIAQSHKPSSVRSCDQSS